MVDVTLGFASEVRRSRALLAAAIVPAAALLGVVAVACLSLGIPIELALSDPLAEVDAHPLLGFVSNLGVLLWSGAAGACLVAVVTLRGSAMPAGRELRRFFAASVALTTVLMLDDLFQVHEDLLPRLLGHGQTFVLAGYVILLIVYVRRFRRSIFASSWVVLATAGCFFAVSILVDLLPVAVGLLPVDVFGNVEPERYGFAKHLIEDGSKFIGIALWLTYFVSTAAAALLPRAVNEV